jgi:hypothetical protein
VRREQETGCPTQLMIATVVRGSKIRSKALVCNPYFVVQSPSRYPGVPSSGVNMDNTAKYDRTATNLTQRPDLKQSSGEIAYCSIFPKFGVARVGDSTDCFLSPEAPGIPPDPESGFKDPEGQLKRQAVRFRVYGFDDQGKLVKGLTAANTQSNMWSVSVANKRAGWHEFSGAAKAQGLFEGTLPTGGCTSKGIA